MSELTLYKGEVFDFIDSPLNRKDAYRYFPDGALVVQDGKIIDCGPFKEVKGRYTDYEQVDYSGKLLMPGFIDSHIHYPQAEIIGMIILFQRNRGLLFRSMRTGWPVPL